MLDNGDIRAWTPNVARRSLTPTEASMDPTTGGGYVPGPQKYNKVPGDVPQLRGRGDVRGPAPPQPRFGGIAKAAEEKAAEDSLPGPGRHRDRQQWGLTPDGGQVENCPGSQQGGP